jgi:hypothetical protein
MSENPDFDGNQYFRSQTHRNALTESFKSGLDIKAEHLKSAMMKRFT